jgi:hypothetical protein
MLQLRKNVLLDVPPPQRAAAGVSLSGGVAHGVRRVAAPGHHPVLSDIAILQYCNIANQYVLDSLTPGFRCPQ